jgi:hypothetical protein
LDVEGCSTSRIQLLLEALFMSGGTASGEVLRGASLEWITEWLGLAPTDHFGVDALRHLVAIQLAPRSALAYQESNPKPRWRLIDEYLAERYSLDDREREEIGRLVAGLLDAWSSSRGSSFITAERAEACAICRLPFGYEPSSVITRDPYKPIWQAPDELSRPEVDHIIPIAGLGRHRVENLQVICRACNVAKGSGLVIDPDVEIRHAGADLESVPRVHFFRLLQWLIGRHGVRCPECGRTDRELTMRPVIPSAALVRTSLVLTCYECATPV